MESRRTSSASLSSDDKDDTPELAAAAPTLSKLPLYKYQLAHPESILIRPLYNLSLKRRGGQHPHRTKMEEEVDMIENGVHSKLESSGLAMQPLIALIITKALV